MTSDDNNHQRRDCPEGSILGRIQCGGGHCRNIRIGCFPLSSKCELSYIDSDLAAVIVNEAMENFCPEGHVATGLRCYGDRCKRHNLMCRRVIRADP